ncbi:unnamed protein product [Rotaria sp. Silwood1]|nr:unnamed protein product [Rotaria sp. Silwood1]
MLIRTIIYCSTFEEYLYERKKLRMALLLNKYPGEFIEKQFNKEEKIPIDYGKTMFIHFTYCLNMKTFPEKFHDLWDKYFMGSPIDEIKPVLGTPNVKNLQQ